MTGPSSRVTILPIGGPGRAEPAPDDSFERQLSVELTPDQLVWVLSAAGKTISIPVRVDHGPGWKRVVMVDGHEGDDDHEDIYDFVVTDDFEDGV